MTYIRHILGRVLVLFVLAALSFTSCEKNPLGTVDAARGSAPMVRSLAVTPDTLELLSETTTFQVRVVTDDADGPATVAGVIARLVSEDGIMLGERELTRAATVGAFEDPLVASGRLQQGKRYAVAVMARDETGLHSGTASHFITVLGPNAPPSVGLPGIRQIAQAGDSFYVLVTASVRDTNGLATVTGVTARGVQSTDTASTPMFDDGRRTLTGDASAGDGVFSAFLWIRPALTPQQLGVAVTAVDRSGGLATATRFMTNQPPVFVRLDVPGTIQRPATGTATVVFRATVDDPDGIADIDSVYFINLSSSQPTIFLMFDNGNLLANGDSVALDGRYARILSIDAGTTPGDKDFRFHAVDKAGARTERARTITIQ